jgi:hypothetical protein
LSAIQGESCFCSVCSQRYSRASCSVVQLPSALLNQNHHRRGGDEPADDSFALAQEQGLFAKQNIEARIVLIKGAPILVASLISGDLEIGYTGGTSVLGAAASGPYSKNSLIDIEQLTHTMLAHPSLKSASNCAANAFGIQSMGGTTWMHTILGLEYVGLDVKRDNISILMIGDSVLIGQSLGSRQDRCRGARRRLGAPADQ